MPPRLIKIVIKNKHVRGLEMISSLKLLFNAGVSTLLFVSSQAQDLPTLPASFDSSLYHPMDLDRHCKDHHGWTAHALQTGDHAYNLWRCRVWWSTNHPISLDSVCKEQYGQSYTYALLGGHANHWACVDWADAKHEVVPVVMISSEYFWDSESIKKAVESSASVLDHVCEWYSIHTETGQTFSVNRPIVHISPKSDNNNDWNTPKPGTDPRYALLYAAVEEAMKTTLGEWPEDIIVPIFVYLGPDAQDYGAAALGQYAVAASDAASCGTTDDDFYCGLYGTAHELGHSFGLSHPCELDPVPDNCNLSIMQNPSNFIEDAVLLEHEKETLNNSPFFA